MPSQRIALIKKKKLSEGQFRPDSQINPFSLMYSSEADVYWAVGHQLNLLAFNNSFANSVKQLIHREPIIGENVLYKEYPSSHLALWKKKFQQALGGKEQVWEYEGIKKNNTKNYFKVKLSPIKEGKKTTGVFAQVRNITEEKNKTLLLQQEKIQLETVLKTSRIGIWSWDIQTNKITLSKVAYQILGISLKNQTPALKDFLDLTSAENIEILRAKIKTALLKGIDFDVCFQVQNAQNHKLLTIKTMGRVIYSETKVPLILTGIIHDITEQKKIEEAIKNKNEELEKLNTELDNFIYSASHDLKMPVVNITSLLKVLQSHPEMKNPRFQTIMKHLLNSSKRLNNTLEGVVHALRSQKNVFDDIESVSLKNLIDEIKLDCYEAISNGQVNIIEKYEVDNLTMSRLALKSILYNLISNAIKFRSLKRQAVVLIETKIKNGKIQIIISDNGQGIDLKKNRANLFNMFKRLQNDVEGTGLGLYIVKRLIESNRGEIDVRSRLNKGTTFSILFPLI